MTVPTSGSKSISAPSTIAISTRLEFLQGIGFSATFFLSFCASQVCRMSGISAPQAGFWHGTVLAQMYPTGIEPSESFG